MKVVKITSPRPVVRRDRKDEQETPVNSSRSDFCRIVYNDTYIHNEIHPCVTVEVLFGSSRVGEFVCNMHSEVKVDCGEPI